MRQAANETGRDKRLMRRLMTQASNEAAYETSVQ